MTVTEMNETSQVNALATLDQNELQRIQDAEQLIGLSEMVLARGKYELNTLTSIEDVIDRRAKAKALDTYIQATLQDRVMKLEAKNNFTELVLRQQRKLGELLAVMPKNRGAMGNPGGRGASIVQSQEGTAHTLADLSITKKESARWQLQAKLPEELFEMAVADAKENHWELSNYDIEQRVKQWQNGSLFTSESPEWYTPPEILDLVRAVLGPIDLDPASSIAANAVVRATRYYDAGIGGLAQSWASHALYLNPPYGDTINDWIARLVDAYEGGECSAAITLVPARTDTAWFRHLREFPRCFVNGRIQFVSPGGTENSAPFPSAVVYLGNDIPRFFDVFRTLGDVYVRYEGQS